MLDEPAPEGWLRFDDISSGHLAILDDVAPDPRDAVNIQFTSGTTGRPKGVTLSHRNILNNGAAVGVRAGLRAGDRLCIPVPLYHCFGMVMGNLACVTHGAAMVRSEEHTSELQSLMRNSYAVFCLKKKKNTIHKQTT